MMQTDATALDDPSNVFSYFARFSNHGGQHLTAIRRAAQFKRILKNKLLQIGTDALKIVQQKTFKLDNDFDVLVEDDKIHILRASGFAAVAALHNVIPATLPSNVARMQAQMPFIDLAPIETAPYSQDRHRNLLLSKRGGPMEFDQRWRSP
jgi:hypothetical protein